MKTFSLLQESLTQSISRLDLEAAIKDVGSLARADCAKLQREMYGIVVSALTYQEALAFQIALQKHQFPTAIVADLDVPLLHDSFQIQGLKRKEDDLIFTNSMGKMMTRPLEDLVFIAAGFFDKLQIESKVTHKIDRFAGRQIPRVLTERLSLERNELQFRIDFFFSSGPHRLHASLREDNVLFFHDISVRWKDIKVELGVLAMMRHWLPIERLSMTLQDPSSGRIYPNLLSYEEEIRWHFHRATRRDESSI